MKNQAVRPSPYDFQDYREYLAALLRWFKQKNISLRSLAQRLDVSPALLSSIIQGRRNLTASHLADWQQVLGWDAREMAYLEKLLHLQSGDELSEKTSAMKKISRLRRYKERSTQEFVTWKYLEKWWIVAIRELSGRGDFKPEVEWVQSQLKFPVPKEEVRKALHFLQEHKLLATDGEFLRLECHGSVYKLALTQFHAQMLERVVDSIYKTPSDQRHILGHTMLLSKSKIKAMKLIMDKALEQIAQLEDEADAEQEVFHIGLMGVPLTKKE